MYSEETTLTEDIARIWRTSLNFDSQHLQFGAHRGALGHLTPEIHRAFMADEREHQEEPSQGSPANPPEASTSGGNTQIANLTRLVEELTRKHNTQQSQMESIIAENQVLKNQLMAINTQAAYSYYYNPYVGYSAGASTGGWQQATPYYPQGARNTTHSPVAPMQPLTTPGTTPMGNERQAQQHYQQQQPAHGSDSRRHANSTRHSTPNLPLPQEGPVPPRTMKVEEMM
ncbi:hypothetical protein TIFTF001_016613 [Ficus carica]|uniref:Uncharacterized protein n=1 Tax=Ficus carica TaxID=3494 RepID=A0AA88AP34_FICCA|nr:hypothetical protein TIFTF001_016613 [Ficus carica]